ncbi:TMhelix containing protein [Vibrio phage 468E53-1]|nr:TMhelix containing protein [Vibrio phage 468E53-1]CAH9015686.1 TMhelix containing protein [Vibrio phage 177E37-1]
MKEWTLYLLRTTAEFFWFSLVYIAKALKWVGMNLWKLMKPKKKTPFSTASESEKLRMDAKKKRPEYVKRLQKVEADMAEQSAKFKVLSEEQSQLLQMISVADGGLDKPMSRSGGNSNNGNNNNGKQKGGNNNNGGNKQPAISTFKPTMTS